MESQHPNKTTNHKAKKPELRCSKTCCFFCTVNEPSSSLRRTYMANYFEELPHGDDQENVLVLSSLWNTAMTQPDDPEFPCLGIFECMAKFIDRGINDDDWLSRDQNIYVPYYAAHIIGSYTMNKAQFAEMAVKSGVILPLLELLRGKISWVEQRVAVRALGHLASHQSTFEAVAAHETEIISLAMEIASTCLDVVYRNFVGVKDTERLKYHCDLLTRGVRELEIENRKAEEWASQLQYWSLFLLNCFACKERSSINQICKQGFLKDLCGMWGGLANRASPVGIGLIRTLCNTKKGRKSIADSKQVLESLCNLSRSSDDWQYKAIECLLLILKDNDTRHIVLDIVILFLADLVELKSVSRGMVKVGDRITQTILQDYSKIKYGKLHMKSKRARRALEEIWELKVERRKRETLMSEQEVGERKTLAGMLKREGNQRFWSGDIKQAVVRYTKALDLCLLKMKRERTVLYSNRAQCYLLLKEPELAISDTTRALCLSGEASPHNKSLWRRSQAYDMKGLAKESLMDCFKFINGRIKLEADRRNTTIPYHAAHMINKQMNATWIFAAAKSKTYGNHEVIQQSKGKDQVNDISTRKTMEKKDFLGMSNMVEESLVKKGQRWKKQESRAQRRKCKCVGIFAR
ncbi:uncharacterized protein LOC132266955 [Cornus florida]|uniref:uncharacterized protein LOC132266955 n=1 Tax=Cornus florida TaxID=4283 RepID=UPI00289E5FBE|nr:uncharacterized protein LOC132266955 [Cornus florida]